MRYLNLTVHVSLIAMGALLAGGASAQRRGISDPPQNGYWEPAFAHDLTGFDPAPQRFNTVHMALVPKGPHRGHVLVWDVEGPQPTVAWDQRWAIIDASEPGAPVFWNGELTLPEEGGDFFCAGHAWTSDGELLVAGGTRRYVGGVLGGRLVYLWDPDGGPTGAWRRQPDLAVDRYYPTVTLIDTGELLIAGGRPRSGDPHNDYEVFTPRHGAHGHARFSPPRRFAGPQLPADEFNLYPCIHQLESGEQFVSGPGGASAKMNHALAPGRWTHTDSTFTPFRKHVNSVLAPRRPGAPEFVWTIGGDAYDEMDVPQGALDTVEACVPGAAGAPDWDWSQLPSLGHARESANAVLLPDGRVLVVGGRSGGAEHNSGSQEPESPVTVPEVFDGVRWVPMLASTIPRTYHSAAVLLPSGKVLVGGGNTATQDYEVFVPPYVLSPARPRVLSSPSSLPYSGQNPAPRTVTFEPLPAGEFLDRVVLLAPGSVTHHFDASQRYVELVVESVTDTSVTFRGPSHAAQAPRGHYMLFLVTASGIPSVARWVVLG